MAGTAPVHTRFSASVVVYGGGEEAVRCAESLCAHTAGPLSVFLVDNASPDDSLRQLQTAALPANVRVVPLAQNRGFGAGHNSVLPLLQSRYHAVLNPDILLESDALDTLGAFLDAHPDVAICAPRLVNPDGTPQNLPKRRLALLPLIARQIGWRALEPYNRHYLMLDEDLSKPTDVESCSGSFFVIRTDVFKAIGGFDERYFMYVEDADITQKALQKGRAVYVPGACAVHAWHRKSHTNPRHFLWQVQGMFRFFSKWGFRLK